MSDLLVQAPVPTLRLATRDDLPSIVRIYARDDIHAYPEVWDASSLGAYVDALDEIAADPNNELWVAEVDGNVVGTFQLTFIRQLTYRGARIAQIESVLVDAPFCGRGIGSHMMRFAIARARERGCLRAQLTSNKKRKDAHRFYERLGFVATHEGMKLYLPT
jgi:GNAT superfamily N-acetyltransferase